MPTSSKKLKERWLDLITEYGNLAISNEMWVTHFKGFHFEVFRLSPGFADHSKFWILPYPTYSANFLHLAGYLVCLPNDAVYDLWYSSKVSKATDKELLTLWESLYTE